AHRGERTDGAGPERDEDAAEPEAVSARSRRRGRLSDRDVQLALAPGALSRRPESGSPEEVRRVESHRRSGAQPRARLHSVACRGGLHLPGGSRPPRVRLNLPVIEATLRRVQREFDGIQRALGSPRDPMSGAVIDNIVAGYALVDVLLADGTDVLAPGNLKQLLELNTLVLCGTSAERRAAYAPHVAATERRFYDDRHAGIEDLMQWCALHA